MNGIRRRVLISGASIAGPTLGYWLHRHGFDVTLVERAPTIRLGGYAIDVRGTAIDVIERMGILPALKAAHVHTRKFTFIRQDGRKVGSIDPDSLMGAEAHKDVELPRGSLTSILHDLTRDKFEYIFSDHVTALEDGPDEVTVTFQSGQKRSFDLVIGADGLHSRTRAMVFGPEERFSRYLGYCFGVFTMPNEFGMVREGCIFNAHQKMAGLYAIGDQACIHGIMVMKMPEPSREALGDAGWQRQTLHDGFAGEGWMVPSLLKGLDRSDDLYFDAMMQIRMPSWSRGRVALVGDAAFAPSFFSGQGTSIALVGAYVLANALASHASHEEAFKEYERLARPFIEANQATAADGSSIMVPDNPTKLWLRNSMIRLSPILSRLGLVSRNSRKVHSLLDVASVPQPAPITSGSA
ncbi:FAD-dependent monooxygenase [Niveispirillum sp.]|uniref:FAD-dependent monooxygenase n=1 Tax=Niveispirillum sp. TaxID=1917217 RepID=UPI001B58B9FB|nr:FAD-dependent monooxygenase [Niveispirillum sp.]MBP7334290.1 FAD-dependent monooxygenase [Niveispirillum sp.]